MRETLFVCSARNISAPLLAEITELLKRNFPARAEPMVPSEDDEFLREVWQEVGDDLHQAMRDYPLSQAAAAWWSAGALRATPRSSRDRGGPTPRRAAPRPTRGPETIRWHLSEFHGVEVSVSTIRRHLVAAGCGEAAHLMCQIWPSPSLTSTHISSLLRRTLRPPWSR